MKTIFADYTSLLSAGNNLQKVADDLEKDLVLISDWLKHNRLLLNIKKSSAMIFKWKYQNKFDQLNTNIDAINNIEIKCDGENVPFVQKFTLLGVTNYISNILRL
jgi:hypothetical protein